MPAVDTGRIEGLTEAERVWDSCVMILPLPAASYGRSVYSIVIHGASRPQSMQAGKKRGGILPVTTGVCRWQR